MNKAKDILDRHLKLKNLTDEHIHIAAYTSCLDAINEALTLLVVNSRIAELEEENYKLRYMVENGLGEADLENDCL